MTSALHATDARNAETFQKFQIKTLPVQASISAHRSASRHRQVPLNVPPMRRLRGMLPSLLSITFAALCLTVAIASFRHTQRWGFSTLHMRYTLVVDRGKLLVRGSVPPAKEDARAWELL